MGEIETAILTHTSKGRGPTGVAKDFTVDERGSQNVSEPVTSSTYRVPGITAASAYTAADAFGTKFILEVPVRGVISQVVFRDYDNEGVVKELVLFDDDFTATADHDAFAVSDADMAKCIGVINIDVFFAFANNQIGISTPALFYEAPQGQLWCQMVTRGADNIAAAAIPDITISVV